MTKPLVSIIVRTCGRPQVLRNALESIQAQTYTNIEVIVVEDGPNLSEGFIKETFPYLTVHYHSTVQHMGRCKAGNMGMELATGKYLNFLDDDDYLLPNHVSTLVEHLEVSNCKAAYSIAEEHQIKATPNGPRVKRKIIRYKQPFNKLLLCYMNYIPIQSIMFQKVLYGAYGGLDESLNVLEDWDLWVRYATHCDFLFIPTVTSVYHTPYKGRGKQKREAQLHQSANDVIKKHQLYQVTFDVQQINKDMDYVLNIFNKKGILFYMQKIRNFLLYRDI